MISDKNAVNKGLISRWREADHTYSIYDAQGSRMFIIEFSD